MLHIGGQVLVCVGHTSIESLYLGGLDDHEIATVYNGLDYWNVNVQRRCDARTN